MRTSTTKLQSDCHGDSAVETCAGRNKDCSLTAHPLFPVEVQGVAAGLESVFTTLKKITSFVLACSLSKYLQYLDRVFILFFTKNKTNVQTSTPQKL